jgi:hypothetical protein
MKTKQQGDDIMTNQEAQNLILSQIKNKALSYNFKSVIIEPIKNVNTDEISGYCITSDFSAEHKDYTSNYSVKVISLNDGSIFKL